MEQLEGQGFRIEVPREVLQEMKDLKKKSKTSHEVRVAIYVALEMVERRKVKKTSMGEGRVDDWLIKRGNEGFYIATLDAGIKNKIDKT